MDTGIQQESNIQINMIEQRCFDTYTSSETVIAFDFALIICRILCMLRSRGFRLLCSSSRLNMRGSAGMLSPIGAGNMP